MPHNSAGWLRSGSDQMVWSWNTSNDKPVPIFSLNDNTTDFLWPVAALPVGEDGLAEGILLITDRVRASSSAPLGFENVASTVVRISIASGSNPPGLPQSGGLPAGWTYSTCDLPWTGTNGLMWSSSVFTKNTTLVNGKVVPMGSQGSQELYLLGDYSPPSASRAGSGGIRSQRTPDTVRMRRSYLRSEAANQLSRSSDGLSVRGGGQIAVLASVTAGALAKCDLSDATFLQGGKMQKAPATGLDPSKLDRLFDAVPESSVVYRESGGNPSGHVLLSIPFFGVDVQMHVAPDGPEGPWQGPETISTIPAPWSNSSEFFCYAPKFHPGVVRVAGESPAPPPAAGGSGRTLFSWVCNAVNFGTLFEPGRMDSYIPYFFWMNW